MQFGLIEAIRHWGRYRPNKTALYSNGRSFTYGHLLTETEVIAQAVLDTTDGRRVAVATQQKAAFVQSVLGIMRAGKSAVILNPHLADDGLRVTVGDTKPNAILYDRDLANKLASTVPETIPQVIVESIERTLSRRVPWPEYRARDEWGIVFSSGSTGVPKGNPKRSRVYGGGDHRMES